MITTVTLWVLQFAGLFVMSFVEADSYRLSPRFRAAFTQPQVSVLATGCLLFLLTSIRARVTYDVIGFWMSALSFLVELLLLAAAIRRGLGVGGLDFIFGSACFASLGHALAQGLVGTTGIRLGYLRDPSGEPPRDANGKPIALHYTGERHLLTVAPTRAGKGVSTIIPNLLSYQGSCIIIDPKGENARATYSRRAQLGRAFALDPWGISGAKAARFNPLDMLVSDSSTLIEDATLIAEALVVPEAEGNGKHFSEQASDLIKGFLLHLATAPQERRTLGRLRAILTMAPKDLATVGIAMSKSLHPIVRAAAAQFITKSEVERLGVLSTAQRNTHFLDSPALQASLAVSDFSFADLKGKAPVSIYMILPVDRISSHSRWLRMIVAQAIAVLARTPAKPARPVLFMLDEFAQLGRMPIIEDAYGLMAGMGLQMHAIVQDLSQLKRLYGDGWQTFAANAGVMQFFNTRDLFTAQYVSSLIGTTTRTVRSTSSSTGSGGNGSSSSNRSHSVSLAPTQRPLLFPDELMRMDRSAQVLFVENADPILASKITWHKETEYQQLAGQPALGDRTTAQVHMAA